MAFQSMEEFARQVGILLDNILFDEVFESVSNVQLEHIDKDVMSVYRPAEYERRDNGLESPKNIWASRSAQNELVVENMTSFNPDYGTENYGYGLVGLIEYGDGWRGFFYDYQSEKNTRYLKPRPFIANTKKDLKANQQYVQAMKDGLKARGVRFK